MPINDKSGNQLRAAVPDQHRTHVTLQIPVYCTDSSAIKASNKYLEVFYMLFISNDMWSQVLLADQKWNEWLFGSIHICFPCTRWFAENFSPSSTSGFICGINWKR